MKNATRMLGCIIALTAVAEVAVGSVGQNLLNDTEIRVLLVVHPDLTNNEIQAAKDLMQLAWTTSNIHTGTKGAPIVFANGGVALNAHQSTLQGSLINQVAKLETFATEPQIGTGISRRDEFAADIVFGLTRSAQFGCGLAPANQWAGLTNPFDTNKFDPDPSMNDLDLEGSEDAFVGVAVIRENSMNCGVWTAGHEFGHLFGGGHHVEPPFSQWLKDEKSRATYECSIQCVVRFVTMIADVPGEDACPGVLWTSPQTCVHTPKYSNGSYGSVGPSSGYNNKNALKTTARSVANYRSGVGQEQMLAVCGDGIDNDGDSFVDSADSDCGECDSEMCPVTPPPPPPSCNSTTPPEFVFATLTAECAANPPTGTPSEYRIEWYHACPFEVATFEVWSEEPPGSAPSFKWSTTALSTGAFIDGGSAKALIRACGLAGCSPLAGGPIVVDRC